jgi:hypothetical protein
MAEIKDIGEIGRAEVGITLHNMKTEHLISLLKEAVAHHDKYCQVQVESFNWLKCEEIDKIKKLLVAYDMLP